MKNNIFKIALLVFCVCNVGKINAQYTNDFVEIHDYQKVNFEVLSEDNSLKLNKPTKVKFTFEKSDPKTITLSSPNMKILREENTENSVMVEITAKEKFIEDNTFSVRVSGKYDGKFWIYKIKIPVK